MTLHADDGSFPDGTVNVRGEIVTPMVHAEKTTIDFGDVLPGAVAQQPLVFFAVNDLGSSIYQSDYVGGPFSLQLLPFSPDQQNVSSWVATFSSSVPGEHSASIPLSTAHVPPSPAGCEWGTTISLHAHVLGDAGVAD